ncbi:MAG: hypothetical protein ACLPJH_16930 [Myxococcaceae bacterium]
MAKSEAAFETPEQFEEYLVYTLLSTDLLHKARTLGMAPKEWPTRTVQLCWWNALECAATLHNRRFVPGRDGVYVLAAPKQAINRVARRRRAAGRIFARTSQECERLAAQSLSAAESAQLRREAERAADLDTRSRIRARAEAKKRPAGL